MGAIIYPKGTQAWRPEMTGMSPDQIKQAYESGFSGIFFDEDAADERAQTCTRLFGADNVEDLATSNGWAGAAAGELVLTFLPMLEQFPRCLPGGAQGTGDCVSWGQRNAYLFTMVADVISGMADAVSGKIEGFPDVSATATLNGVIATEYLYGFRGHGGAGWSCDASANAVAKYGMILRQNYPELGVNYERYDVNNATRYGTRPPPENYQAVGKLHLGGASASISAPDSLRDAIANGHGVNSCGSEGFASQRDANGFAKRSGSWPHSMQILACDNRPWVKQAYGEDFAFLVPNSWGISWISGSRDIYDSAKYVPASKRAEWEAKDIVNPKTGNILIPEGSFWCPWKDIRNRSFFALSGIRGWAPKPRMKFDVDIG
jgi:hypothetical protein